MALIISIVIARLKTSKITLLFGMLKNNDLFGRWYGLLLFSGQGFAFCFVFYVRLFD